MTQTAAFWDSSSLVPLCTTEQASDQIKEFTLHYTFVVWWATAAEVNSAFARLLRLGELNEPKRKAVLERFSVIRASWHEIVPSDEVRDQAISLLYTYPLRAADSLQLAAAMVWCRNKPAGRTFICSDTRLGEAATQAGFTVLTP